MSRLGRLRETSEWTYAAARVPQIEDLEGNGWLAALACFELGERAEGCCAELGVDRVSRRVRSEKGIALAYRGHATSGASTVDQFADRVGIVREIR